ncbi:hypothetical protein EQ826_00160 [Ectopseudomonas mendocina]|nr:hypothetical protein [Pseudomonas mendocina]TRO21973.1 hypothetical protein EQ828_12865 [Pseudomonas mendocina]TRO29339.1 hypothetical protein EQ826_00160 [Pseudomonas mendocina]
MSIWMRIRDWAASKHREQYLQRYHVNLKCPHCNVWSSDCENESSHVSCGHPIATQYNCGQCGKPSYWVCEAGFWFSAERFGVHIKPDTAHAELRLLAEAASQGDWQSHLDETGEFYVSCPNGMRTLGGGEVRSRVCEGASEADAAFIAALSPAVVLALLGEVQP